MKKILLISLILLTSCVAKVNRIFYGTLIEEECNGWYIAQIGENPRYRFIKLESDSDYARFLGRRVVIYVNGRTITKIKKI